MKLTRRRIVRIEQVLFLLFFVLVLCVHLHFGSNFIDIFVRIR